MTDQGYPPHGESGGEQQPHYPTQPFPQYPAQPGHGQQPPYPGDPAYGQSQQPPYPGDPAYGQPQQPPYPGDSAYGQPQQPQYPGQPGYGPPPGYGAPGGPTGPYGPGGPGPAGGGGNRKPLLAALAAAVVVAAAVVAYFLFSGGSTASASSAKDAVKKLLEAGKNNDVDAAKKVLCDADIAAGVATKLGSSGRVVSYTIGKTSKQNGITVVDVTSSTTKDPKPQHALVPVVQEGGKWKVCVTKLDTTTPSSFPSDTGGPTDTGFPSGSGAPSGPSGSNLPSAPNLPTATGLPSSLPSGFNICARSATALAAARSYVSSASVGLPSFAQTCVYKNSVPLSVAASLKGKLYIADTSGPSSGPFVFKSTDGSATVTVTITKEPDGKFYVTGVQTG